MIKTFPLDSLSDKLSDPFKSYVYDFCVKFNYGVQLLDNGDIMVFHLGVSWSSCFYFRSLNAFCRFFPDLVVELGGDPYCPVFTH